MNKHKKVNIGTFTINYVYEKENENHPLVLFLHGFSDSLTSFISLINRQDRAYNYAAFDFPGCGKSSSENNLKLETYSYVTDEFINKVLKNEKEIIVVSHSLGSFSALSVLNNNKVKKAILISPFNYNLNKENPEKKEQLEKWLIPQNYEDAEEAYLSFFSTVTPSIINSSKLYAKNALLNFHNQKNKFEWMLKNEILNYDFLEKKVKPLFLNNKNYSIIVGCQDKLTSVKELNEVADEVDIEYVTIWSAGHAIFVEASEFIGNYINQKASRD